MENQILASVLTRIGESLVKPIGRQFGYLIHYDRKFEKLKDQIEKLEALRNGWQGSIDAEIRSGKVIRTEVNQWITKVDGFMPEAINFLGDVTDSNKMCLSGWCPDLITRYQIGKHAVKKAIVVTELQEGGKFSIISHPAPPLGIQAMPSRDFVPYETTNLVKIEVMEALKDEKTNIIGIHGMGGVGKTTLVTEIGKHVKVDKLFDEVVMSVVSQNVEFKKIQGQMADMLGLKLNRESDNGRADQLKARLKDVNKVLVILDDVWSRLDVAALGIPFGDEHKGCKVIITTRRQQIFNAMGLAIETRKIFHLGVLSEQESWDLLRRNAGDAIEYSPTLNAAAKEISKECRGLPIAIVTVGRALRDKEPEEWKEAAEELKKSEPTHIEGVEDDVYRCIKLSYDYLRDEEAKSCFLLCSLFPEDGDILIESLVRYGMGLGIFKKVDTVREATRRAYSLTNNLIASCLLLASGREGCVKMHDVVRDVAISIGSNLFFVRSGVQLEEWPEVESFERYTGISLMNNRIRRLPTGLESRNLQILLLQNNFFEGVVAFEGMKALRVLDLSHNYRGVIVSSSFFCNLTCLRTLIIEYAEVRNIDELVQIKTLEVLSLRNCQFDESPNAIRQLTSLRVLDMSCCKCINSNLSVIRPNILSNLSRLEELYLLKTKIEQEVPADLKSFPRLAVLTLSMSDFPENFVLPDCELFSVYSTIKFSSIFDTRNSLYLEGPARSMKWWRKCAEVLLKKTNLLQLRNFTDIKNILPFLSIDGDGLNVLKSLEVLGCNEFEYLINAEEWGLPPQALFLPNLEELFLEDLASFKGIWHGALPLTRKVPDFGTRGLHNLREVTIYGCPKLKNLFQPCLARKLHKLEVLKVVKCEKLEEIVAKENQWQEEDIAAAAEDKLVFESLRKLTLRDLPNLDGFCTGSFLFEWPSLNEVKVSGCPKMKTFTAATTSEFKSAPMLKQITLDHVKRKVDGADINTVIEKYFKAKVTHRQKR